MKKGKSIVNTQVRSGEGKREEKYIFHNFHRFSFHIPRGAHPEQPVRGILLVRDENKKSIAQPSFRSRARHFIKNTYKQIIIFPALAYKSGEVVMLFFCGEEKKLFRIQSLGGVRRNGVEEEATRRKDADRNFLYGD